MQSDILLKIKHLLKEKNCNINIDKFLEFLSVMKRNKWIYPTAVYRFTKSDIIDIYNALEELTVNGYVKRYVETYCPFCDNFTGQYYENLGNLPDEFNCPNCGEDVHNVSEYATVIYKLKD